MKIFLWIAIVLSLVPLTLAYDYDSYHTEIELVDEQAYVNTQIQGDFISNLSLSVPTQIEDLHVFVDDKEISCAVLEQEMTCSLEEGIHFVQILYHTASPLLSVAEESLAFQWKENISTGDFLFTLKLPEQSILVDEQLFVPEPERKYFDGRRTVLVWEEKDFEDSFNTSVLYQEENMSFPWYLFVIPFLIVALVLYFWKWRKKEFFVSGALLENEKKVLAVLKENNNKLWQKQLELKTGLSKVKLSRLLHSMEKRGLVKKEAYGTSNIIVLVETKEP